MKNIWRVPTWQRRVILRRQARMIIRGVISEIERMIAEDEAAALAYDKDYTVNEEMGRKQEKYHGKESNDTTA